MSPEGHNDRADSRWAWVVFAATFASYALTASPSPGWLDSPELVGAAATLGVAHSPGHPLAGLLGRLATLLPVGEMPFRVSLLSALGSAAAAALACAAAGSLWRRADDLPGARHRAALAGVGVGLAVAWSAAFWMQGVRAEVYSLEAALLLGALLSLFDFDRDRRRSRGLLLAGLACGLALAQHHFIALLFVVPAAAFALAGRRAQRPRPAAWSATALLGLLGLAAFLYLPVRASAGPEVNWADPQTFDRFAWTVSARAFQKSALAEHASSPVEDGAQVVVALADHATPLLFGLALLGAYLGLRDRRLRRVTLLLLAIAGCGAAGRVLVGFDPETPDHHGYLMAAAAAVALVAAVAGAAVAGRFGRPRVAWVLAALLALPAPWQLVRNLSSVSLRGAYGSTEMARAELEHTPPRSLLLISYFETAFRIWGERAVSESRPDVAVLDRSMLTYPGFAELARRRHPELDALISAPLRAGAPTPIDQLRALSQRRPVGVQLHLNLDPAPQPWLLPRGVYAWFADGAGLPGPGDRDRAEAIDQAAAVELEKALSGGPQADRDGARRELLWLDAMRLQYYCEQGRRGAAARVWASAWALASGDGVLVELAQHCGITVP